MDIASGLENHAASCCHALPTEVDSMPLLTFQRDGTVLVEEHDEPDRFLDQEDIADILCHLRSSIAFEPGLTSLGLFRCLRPWGPALGPMAWMDFAAWDEYVTTERLREVGADESLSELESVVLRPKIQYRSRNGEMLTIDVHWGVYGKYAKPQTSVSGGRPDLYCALDFSHPSIWMQLPLVIDSTAEVITLDGTRFVENDAVDVGANLFDTIILGFLDGVSACGSPDDTASVAGSLADAIAEVMIVEADLAAGKPIDEALKAHGFEVGTSVLDQLRVKTDEVSDADDRLR